jgi:hypothetical protein
MNLPPHKCGLSIEHNPHKNTYESVADWIQVPCVPDFESDSEKQKCIDADDMWTMQWYPETPIGFNLIAAPTLEDLLRFALQYQEMLDNYEKAVS